MVAKILKSIDRIIIEKEKNYYKILDGVHRSAIYLNHGLNEINCVEFINYG